MTNKKTEQLSTITAEGYNFVSEETSLKKQEATRELIAKLSDEQFELFQKYQEIERVYTKEYCARFTAFMIGKASVKGKQD